MHGEELGKLHNCLARLQSMSARGKREQWAGHKVQEFTVWKLKTQMPIQKEQTEWTLSLRKTHFKELMCNTSSISMRHCTGYTPDTGHFI